MPMPQDYFQASRDFEAFMASLKRISLLQTTHQCYTMVEAVFHALRSHMSAREALAFADLLPPVLRAIFVSDWDIDVPVLPMTDRAGLQREILALRHNHNLSTPSALEDVGAALRENMEPEKFARLLDIMPAELAGFWR
ncbi:DUF2267 domain-containing protein [Rhizobium sp. C4]|uniref:DUF2267 domain-containing protein n=1 Tax=Rhizobium sp. C4 TaxID=1349800 RepID=UPI001E54A9F4|nr:DUF2267 domain-containing protein [Rhizobium sp. C4]MCD2174052.1 DUF2267 domain-containing protein [Rhizobium sp. C4]